ncbi:hypothetical protein CEXT_435731 [Caerostris extrusa]|uniref:Uncharacterized protein n=1 Tax=Caerostris extrusa TaxID=172846 RepID=A0AAV4V6R1_CAEEX|nr:hypothetical protein CEXT_435731 [Caerostris extrusa]
MACNYYSKPLKVFSGFMIPIKGCKIRIRGDLKEGGGIISRVFVNQFHVLSLAGSLGARLFVITFPRPPPSHEYTFFTSIFLASLRPFQLIIRSSRFKSQAALTIA